MDFRQLKATVCTQIIADSLAVLLLKIYTLNVMGYCLKETQKNSKSGDFPLLSSPPMVVLSSFAVETRPTSSSPKRSPAVAQHQPAGALHVGKSGSGGDRDVANLERRRNREELTISSGIGADAVVEPCLHLEVWVSWW
ncbi:Uncharacterized protein Adt_28870 [Abeliophyllum distichum]|uniref:Uncharacterized protein n=1 Tax=Abeliophyllum distichum TaxID=126358 RepID=A0ABD1RXS2_9LAMI